MPYPGIPREKLPWFPTMNPEVCLRDLDCLNFCPYGVFAYDAETGRPFVAHPYSCVPGCDMCAQLCRGGGITLPSRAEFRAILRRLRAEARGERPLIGGT
ncbi:MAG: ferredoxin family protein [Acidobacteriia bacterium]|nr:ferredoxin family protein [Terriglobia bacterium]